MNKEKAITILELQRDSFLIGLDKSYPSDYDKWCKEQAKTFNEVIEWIKEL